MHGDVSPTVRLAVRADLYLCTDHVGRCVQHQRAEVVTDVEHCRSLSGHMVVAGQVIVIVIVTVRMRVIRVSVAGHVRPRCIRRAVC